MDKAILICGCSGTCPGMEDIDFWKLSEKLQSEFPQIELAMHPRLCEENGERLMGELLSEGTSYITAACKPEKQEKLLRDGYKRAELQMDDDNFIPLALGLKDTETVFAKIKEILIS